MMMGTMMGLPCAAQGTREDYARAEQIYPFNARHLVSNIQVTPHWIEQSNRFWYRRETRSGHEFVLVDPERNLREPLFDHPRLARSLGLASSSSYTPERLPLDSVEIAEQGRVLRFEIESTRWRCTLRDYTCAMEAKGVKLIEPSELGLRSPDGHWLALRREHNLYLRSLATGEEVALTRDGKPDYAYATEAQEERNAAGGYARRFAALWSPDSRKLVTLKVDTRDVRRRYLLRSVTPDRQPPRLYTFPSPQPGDRHRPSAQLVIIDVERKQSLVVKAKSWLATESPITSQDEGDVWWSADGKSIYQIQSERAGLGVSLWEINAETGEARQLLSEQSATAIQLSDGWTGPRNAREVGDGSEIVWYSERDGWGHLYLYDAGAGALKNQITKGSWLVRELRFIDARQRWVYFTAGGREAGRDPYFRHLYRSKLDGSSLELLTPENADHQVSFAPSGEFFLDTYSQPDTAPVTSLRSRDGALICELERADITPLLAKGWRFPQAFTVKAADGVTDLYGAIFLPSSFDARKQYPVIEDIYPIARAPHTFALDQAQSLAELGFIVVTIDGRGGRLRSQAFREAGRGEISRHLDDHVAAIKQLAVSRAYFDLSRVGIYGHSVGGHAAARAILLYPDFYKVAVSSAGVHDVGIDPGEWAERWLGAPGEDRYLDQTSASLARRLKGKLLLAVGEADVWVPLAEVLRFTDALIKENKDFDLLIIPNRAHNVPSHPYFIRKRWDYFVRYLLGKEPPADYRVAPPTN
jgi:dipeptidyl aminopeptidase/acylaminoacyl peptidase